jgi:hypothetical protein
MCLVQLTTIVCIIIVWLMHVPSVSWVALHIDIQVTFLNTIGLYEFFQVGVAMDSYEYAHTA